MKDRSDDPSHHERTLLPRSYISLQISNGHSLFPAVGLSPLSVVVFTTAGVRKNTLARFHPADNKKKLNRSHV